MDEIDQPALRSKVQHAQCAGHCEVSCARNGNPIALVHEYQIGTYGTGERDCRSLAFVQQLRHGAIRAVIGIWSDLKPGRGRCDPGAHSRRRTWMAQLIAHRHGHNNPAE
jgi:hypothetical protein